MKILVFTLVIVASIGARKLISTSDIEYLFRRAFNHELSQGEKRTLKDIFELLRRPDHVSTRALELDSPIRMTLNCIVCLGVLAALFLSVHLGQTPEESTEILTFFCYSLGLEDYNVCRGAVALNMPILHHIILSTPEATPAAFCGMVLQNAQDRNTCQFEDPRFEWQVDLPPPPSDVQPTPNTTRAHQTLTVAIITDAHIDPLYEAYGVADCNEPTCCRKGQKPRNNRYISNFDDLILKNSIVRQNGEIFLDLDDVLKIREMRSSTSYDAKISEPAGYWGDYRNCDTPVWAFDDVIDRMADTHKSSDSNHGEYATVLFRTPFTPATGEEEGVKPRGDRPQDAVVAATRQIEKWLVYDPREAKTHLDFLIDELYKAELAGEMVHILAHIPPGEQDLTYTWTREYNRIVNRFSSTIGAQFNGHMHSDEFKLFYSDERKPINVAWNAGGTTTYSDFNLNYKIATFDVDHRYEIINIENYVYNLTEANLTPKKRPHWFLLYHMKNSFQLKDLSPTSIDDLLVKMVTTNKDLLDLYAAFYYKLSDAMWPYCNTDCKLDYLCQIAVTVLWERQRCNELVNMYHSN